MKNIFLVTLLFSLVVQLGFAQNTKELYMPREYKRAYVNETRSHAGTPGKNYFQNKADYDIQAEFFPDTKLLIGSELIAYTNNSPDTLSWLYINLYQNRFKKGEARDANIDAKNIHNGVKIKGIKVNGTEINSKLFTFYSTILVFPVADKIAPNSATKIEIEWEQKMPVTGLFRIGTYDESNFFVGFWYPKMNVYDDVVGWNTFGHTGNAEFYSDYGDFNVEITVPSDYTVWSSGVLQNTAEIFRDKYIKRINEAALADEVIQIISEADRFENRITKDGDKHSWRFKAENLSDFAFAVSNKYLWDATSAKIGDKRVLVNAVYNSSATNFHTVAEISRKSIEFYSNTVPGIPYPYEQMTVFQGAKNGMEFPAIINDQDESDPFATLFLTTHEIAHTYFPFYVGTNEQEYSWMDESLVTLIGISALADISKTDEATIMQLVAEKYHNESAKLAIDIPLMTGTHSAGDFTYGFMTYIRPTAAFFLLYNYLGKETFYQSIREFSIEWKGKHPIPYDLFHAFNKVAGEDLGWFWKPWFFELGYADIAIGKVEHGTDKTMIQIENQGSFPIPVNLTVVFEDGHEIVVRQRMDIWKSGNNTCEIEIEKGEIKEIILDTNIPEAYYENNRKVVNNGTEKHDSQKR